MRVKKLSEGFTLVELLIVVVLLAIFASIAIPSFTATVRNSRLQSSANELHTLLLSARTDAVSKRNPVTVKQNDDNSWTAAQGGVTINSVTIPTSVEVVPTVKTITFQPDGTATAASIAITNNEDGTSYTVSVTLPGLIKNTKSTTTSPEDQK